ncbi:hypothetical protein ONV75_16410 [Clostridium sp. LQ25]|uniref:hypothetical protein n=1 Tax=Clostridium sp. LQ25 TaxID=2992805 RepID=UPI00224D5163|nr:hypothetical protein [Clostridium sp. LQ25]UZT06163.1 hypothetical protein ONV75_16410 [Clostridium sp. LQ25]
MNFKSEYIRNEIDRLQQLLPDDNRFKQEFIKNKEKLNNLINDCNENNIIDKICQQNLFQFCGFEEYGIRIAISDWFSGYIAFISNSVNEAEKTKDYYIKEYDIETYKENIKERNEVVTTELVFVEKLWGKVLLSNQENRYYLYIYRSNKIDDEDYYLRFNCIDFISFILKKTLEESKRLLISIMSISSSEKNQELIDMYNRNINILDNEIWKFDYLNRFIYLYIEALKQMINLAKNDIHKLNKINNKYYLYCSSSYLAKKINIKDTTARNYLHIFTALELIDKVVNKDDTGMYSIKEFTVDVLNNANMIAKEFIDNKISISKFKKKTSLLMFGEEKTELIFPDKK